MKKMISLMLAVTMMLGICACGGNKPAATTAPTQDPTQSTSGTTGTTGTTQPSFLVPSSKGFDDKNIVLQFASVSDVHVARNAAAQGRVQSAFEQLKEAALLYTEKGLDAVIVSGDLTDDYGNNQDTKAAEIKKLKTAYENVFDPSKVPMVYGLGNHDHDFERNGGAGSDLATFIEVMGNKAAYTQYDVACSDSAHGSRHAVIGNYHFLFVEPITYGCTGADDTGAKYYEETKTWLDNTLKEITESAPNQYVFVSTHAMIYGTVYGSDLLTSGIYWYTKDLTSILDKYPQVVTFGGHLHFPLADERSIMQTNFTALGCGSVQYMAIEQGNYYGMANPGATTMPDNGSVSSGYLVQVDGNGNVRFIRMDFQNKTTIKDPFVIETPKADKSHLTKYGTDRGDDAKNSAPVLSANAVSVKDNAHTDDDVLSVTVNFTAGTDDDLIHHYVLQVLEGGAVKESYNILSDFYRHGKVSDMKKEYSIDLVETYSRGAKYQIALVAYDSWGKESNKVVYAYEPKLDVSKVTFPDVYADIDFANGTATDTKGKINIELVGGASVGSGSFTMGGKTFTANALNITAEGQYAKLKFAGFDGDMDSFLKKSFTVELIYVNRTKTGTQGIFSGIEEKGFGVLETEGVPTFKACIVKTVKETAAKSATSADELVHVLATYSPQSALFAIYVNGEQYRVDASGNPKGQGDVFALGANIKKDGTADSFASNLSIVDVKFYNAKFSQAQALVRYQNVLTEYTK